MKEICLRCSFKHRRFKLLQRTQIKICGITRREDAIGAAYVGADAIGFIFYQPSPRYIAPEFAQKIAWDIPSTMKIYSVFVNEDANLVREILTLLPQAIPQFHGEEDLTYCQQFSKPYIKAMSMKEDVDPIEFCKHYPTANAFLADSYVPGYGGQGVPFLWERLQTIAQRWPIILAGGLHADNVGKAIATVRPWGVDVASGVESAKGIKDLALVEKFVAAVKKADEVNNASNA